MSVLPKLAIKSQTTLYGVSVLPKSIIGNVIKIIKEERLDVDSVKLYDHPISDSQSILNLIRNYQDEGSYDYVFDEIEEEINKHNLVRVAIDYDEKLFIAFNKTHHVNIFNLNDTKLMFLNYAFRFSDYGIFKYGSKISLFWDTNTSKIHAYAPSTLINECNERKDWECVKWFVEKFLKVFQYGMTLKARDYYFTSEHKMYKFLKEIIDSQCFPRIIHITNKVVFCCRLEATKTKFSTRGLAYQLENRQIRDINLCSWAHCRTIDENSHPYKFLKLGVCSKKCEEVKCLHLDKESTVMLWGVIKRPLSFDPNFFEIPDMAEDDKRRDLSSVLKNVYLLFDYDVHQFWNDNQFQPEWSYFETVRSMFHHDSNMHLVVNAKDDWQIKNSKAYK